VVNYDGDTVINTTGGTVSGGTTGLYARQMAGLANTLPANLTVIAGAVEGGLTGIDALNTGYTLSGNADTLVEATAGVTGTLYGIRATNQATAVVGTSNLRIVTLEEDVTGTGVDGVGIGALNGGSGALGSSLTIETGGTVFGIASGIDAANLGVASNGFSDLAIVAQGPVTGQNTYGILAANEGTGLLGSSLSITTGFDVSGGVVGIAVVNYGDSAEGRSDLIIEALGNVTGGSLGIGALNDSLGFTGSNVVVTAQGDVSSTTENAIRVINQGTSASGTSDAIVRTYGTVTSGSSTAIFASGSASGSQGSRVIVETEGDVSGGVTGIFASNSGTSSSGAGVTVTSSGEVEGVTGIAIHAENSASGKYSNVLVDASGDLSGDTQGIFAFNSGTGSYSAANTTILTSGDVTASSFNSVGIDVEHSAQGKYESNVLIEASGDVSGSLSGIVAEHTGESTGREANLTIVATGAVTGTRQFGIGASHSGTAATGADLTIETEGEVFGGLFGIRASSYATTTGGTSDLIIHSSAGVRGNDQTGIVALNGGSGSGGSSIDILAEGTVLAGQTGILASNDGSSSGGASNLTILTSGTVTGTASFGIVATNSGIAVTGSDLTIGTENTLFGGITGIVALNNGTATFGTSDLTIRSGGSVRGETAYGILAVNHGSGYSGSSLSIVAEDTVWGGQSGIFATNLGTSSSGASDLTIQAVETVTGATAIGIQAINLGDGILGSSLSISASGGVTGGTSGIDAINDGYAVSGASNLTITAMGDVTGQLATGISAINVGYGATGSSVAVYAGGTVTGDNTGIIAGNYSESFFGFSDVSVVAMGDVRGTLLTGIRVNNQGYGAYGSSIAVTTQGVVYGGLIGISALNGANSGFGNTDLTITAMGEVQGGETGIQAISSGTATFGGSILTITATGDVTGTLGDGIFALNIAQGYDDVGIVITTGPGTVSAGRDGIAGIHAGTSTMGNADVSITAGGEIVADGRGIYAYHNGNTNLVFGGSANLTITALELIDAGTEGIAAINLGSAAFGSDLRITAGNILAGGTGIYAYNRGYSFYGSSDLEIRTEGDVDGLANGIRAINRSVSNLYSSDLTIETTGAVTGQNANGLYAQNYGTGGSSLLTITTAGPVTGFANGIAALNEGTATFGDSTLSIDATGAVSGGGSGIVASNEGFSLYDNSSLDIWARGDVTGDTMMGIGAVNLGEAYFGTSLLSIRTQGNVSGHSFGIFAVNQAVAGLGTGITILAEASVDGGAVGIYVLNSGLAYGDYATSNISIVSSGPVSGGDAGIFARNYGYGYRGSNLYVVAQADVTGGDIGIAAINFGTAVYGNSDVGIRAYGAVSGPDFGIYAFNSGVIGYDDGIELIGYGSSNLFVLATGPIESADGTGIRAANAGRSLDASTNVTVIADGNITAALTGIQVFNTGLVREFYDGVGQTSIEIASSGDILAGQNGISAINYGITNIGQSSVTIYSSGSITAGQIGIAAVNIGSGRFGSTVSIVAEGDVTGTQGISAVNLGNAALGNSDVFIESFGTVTGSDGDGISVLNAGASASGASGVSVLAEGDVSGSVAGIRVVNYGTASDGGSNVTITTDGAVTGDDVGIAVLNLAPVTGDKYGDSVVRVTANGDVTGGIAVINSASVSTKYGDSSVDVRSYGTVLGGIRVVNTATVDQGESNLEIRAYGDVLSATDGIAAINNATRVAGGPSRLEIVVEGQTLGITGVGIYAHNYGTDLTITVGEDAIVRGGLVGIAASQNGTGDFSITNDGVIANYSGMTDDVAISAYSGAGLAGVYLLNEGLIVGTVQLTGEDDAFENNGTWATAGASSDFGAGTDLLINTGNTILAGSITGVLTEFLGLESFENSGLINLSTVFGGGMATAGDRLFVSGNFVASGDSALLLDVILGESVNDPMIVDEVDIFHVGGDVSGVTRVALNDLGGQGALTGRDPGDGVVILQVDGAVTGGDFVLLGNSVLGDGVYQVGIFLYDLVFDDTTDPAMAMFRLQSSYLPTLGVYEVYPSAVLDIARLGSMRDRIGHRHSVVGSGAAQSETWVRIDGASVRHELEGSATDTTFRQNVFRLQAGSDVDLGDIAGGRVTAGVTLQFARGTTTVSSPLGDGVISTTGVGLGATLTYATPTGFYLDGQLHHLRLSSRLPLNPDRHSSFATAGSVEVGQRIGGANGWSVTPQAQLSFATLGFTPFTGPFGETVTLGAGSSLRGRIGTSVEREWDGASGGRNSVYGVLSLIHEFRPETGVEVVAAGSHSFTRSIDQTAVQLGIGAAMSWDDDATRVFGSVSASRGLGGDTSPVELQARVGLALRW
jgi:outer membrane autotransporter protein